MDAIPAHKNLYLYQTGNRSLFAFSSSPTHMHKIISLISGPPTLYIFKSCDKLKSAITYHETIKICQVATDTHYQQSSNI